MTRRAGSLWSACCVLAIAGVVVARAQSNQGIDLQQGWTPQQKDTFWFTPQGSLLLPYDWFKYLKKADSDTVLFRDPDNMRRLGYIPTYTTSELNKDLMPIGFAKDWDRDESFVGFTCAACHTSVLRLDDRSGKKTDVIVEGAPALSDFWTFMSDLVDALDATCTDESKFKAFAKDVLGSSHSEDQEKNLKSDLDARRTELRKRWLSPKPGTPYGRGRLDAFGGLYNQVVAYHLGVPGNARVPDAPVSYPFLWDTPQHDWVQWNGTGDNDLLGYGPIFRNIGEALGVFGTVEIKNSKILKYRSSLNVENLKALERLVQKYLNSPVLPAHLTNPDRARQGRVVYNIYCSTCHAILKRTDPKRKVKAQMIDVQTVGTDPRFAVNFAERFIDPEGVATGELKGAPKLFGPERFKERASGGDVFANVIVGAYLGRTARKPGPSSESDDDSVARQQAPGFSSAVQSKYASKYKARPLNGIWATAPYLHNGSVPTIAELLKPAAERTKTFCLIGNDFDAVNVGLVVGRGDDASCFDTSKPGNSNAGHPYGTTLNEDHKRALLEFLKIQ